MKTIEDKTKTLDELKKLIGVFYRREHYTNDSVLMAGDLEKLTELIYKL